MKDGMSEENKADKLKNMMTRNFSITKCPDKVYQAFVEFCQGETNDNYSMGLKLLLDMKNANIKEVVLYEQYMELKADFADLKAEIAELKGKKEETKTGVKTFGSK